MKRNLNPKDIIIESLTVRGRDRSDTGDDILSRIFLTLDLSVTLFICASPNNLSDFFKILLRDLTVAGMFLTPCSCTVVLILIDLLRLRPSSDGVSTAFSIKTIDLFNCVFNRVTVSSLPDRESAILVKTLIAVRFSLLDFYSIV